MYDEIKNDFSEQYKDFPRKKAALWGEAIKELIDDRKGQDQEINVTWLSKKTGISDKHLFNIIAGRIQDPSSDKLIKIADAFKISFPELAQRAIGSYSGNFFICSYGQRGFIDYSQHGFSIQSLSPPGTSNRDFFLGLMTIKPYKELKRWKFKDNSMVCIYVQMGMLEINYGGKIRRVHANESCYFDASIPHKFKNLDSTECHIFLVTRPAIH